MNWCNPKQSLLPEVDTFEISDCSLLVIALLQIAIVILRHLVIDTHAVHGAFLKYAPLVAIMLYTQEFDD